VLGKFLPPCNLYAAMTRSRKRAVLVGTQKALAIAVRNLDARRRVTPLKQRPETADGNPAALRYNASPDADNAWHAAKGRKTVWLKAHDPCCGPCWR
jgi:hypothetical protein